MRSRVRQERGQSTVEFALIVPLVFIAMLAVGQVCLILQSQLAVTHLAREVARALAVDATVDPYDLVDEISSLETDGLVIVTHSESSIHGERDLVVVNISYRSSAIISLFLPFSNRFTVQSEALMLSE